MNSLNEVVDISYKLGGLIAGMVMFLWAANKAWLSNIYVSKKDFKDFMQSNDGTDGKFKEKLFSLDKDFSVFKAEHHGDNQLIKNVVDNTQTMMKEAKESLNELKKDILHKLNNMENYKGISTEAFMKLADKVDEMQRSNTK